MLKWATITVLYVLAAVCGGYATISVAPWLEARFAPIVEDQKIYNVVRSDTRVCWDWEFQKKRDAVAVQFVWSEGPFKGPSLSLMVDQTAHGKEPEPVPVGQRGHYTLCLPTPSIKFEKALTIEGYVIFKPKHAWWYVNQNLPPVTIDEKTLTVSDADNTPDNIIHMPPAAPTLKVLPAK